MNQEILMKEVSTSLKQLARLIVRGFYSIEDALIIDMLVRHACMKEDDLCELLKFDKKQLRARITTLKSEKFVQLKLRMDTGENGKVQKVNCYYINYKNFVNVVKYKLYLIRKRIETDERDATSRATFKCSNCTKTFTDLEADQLFDFNTGEFCCTFCGQCVEEDDSSVPKQDSRLLLAKFNEQLEPVFILLREAEGIKLAPEVLDPEPIGINTIRGLDKNKGAQGASQEWSGEATRNGGFMVEETRVDVTFGNDKNVKTHATKEAPVWMVKSTINSYGKQNDGAIEKLKTEKVKTTTHSDEIMSALLAHEKLGSTNNAIKAIHDGSDSNDENNVTDENELQDVEMMESDEDDGSVPTVNVGDKSYGVTEINETIIATMTPVEKETYIQVFQDYYSHMNY